MKKSKLKNIGMSLALASVISILGASDKWITPTNKICKTNGGYMDEYGCKATRIDAKKICTAAGGRMPTIKELEKVVSDCGGKNVNSESSDDWNSITDKNRANKSYQACYKKKGFTYDYLSSSSYGDGISIWNIGFDFGGTYLYNQYLSMWIRCIKVKK